MYFSEDEINEFIKDINIKDEIMKYINLTKIGEVWVGICPFHKEKSPSFVVDEKKQLYYCNGCGKGGNIITFLMEYNHVSFSEALYHICGITIQTNDSFYKERLTVLEMNQIAAELYQRNLADNDLARDYIKKRNLKIETLINFKMGFSGVNQKELYKILKSKGYTDKDLKNSGLFSFRDDNYVQEKFSKRLMFPIQNVDGHVIGFGGRILEEKVDKKDKLASPKYLNSPETVLFTKSENLFGMNLAKESLETYFIVCEGYMDVIAMHQAGFTNAVASLGTAFTHKQAELIKKYKNNVILAYDSDKAGITAAKRAIPILNSCGLTARLLNMSPYKDPDEYINNCGRDNFYKQCIKSALTVEQWLFKRAFEEDNVNIMVS